MRVRLNTAAKSKASMSVVGTSKTIKMAFCNPKMCILKKKTLPSNILIHISQDKKIVIIQRNESNTV